MLLSISIVLGLNAWNLFLEFWIFIVNVGSHHFGGLRFQLACLLLKKKEEKQLLNEMQDEMWWWKIWLNSSEKAKQGR